jgi:hypothetical protein
MISFEDILATSGRDLVHLPMVDPNPFDQADSWQECQILDVRVAALSGVVGVLFDLRQSLQYLEEDDDTGLLICGGVQTLAWDAPHRETPFTAWSVASAAISVENGRLRLGFDLWPAPGASLDIACDTAKFMTGHAEGIRGTPPDYGQNTSDEILAGVATWASLFRADAATQLRT